MQELCSLTGVRFYTARVVSFAFGKTVECKIKDKVLNKCIVTSSDSKYFPGLIALLRSLRRTNPHIPIIVFDNGLTKRQRGTASRFAEVIQKKPFISIAGKGKFSYIGDTPLLKFEVAALAYDKVLYLDADIIVTKNLDTMFNIPKGTVGVVEEMNSVKDMFRQQHRVKLMEHIHIDWQAKGFNAGAFVLYPNEWRDLKERALALIEYFGEDVFSKSKCQQLLNIIFSGRTYLLGGEYNVSPVYDDHISDPAVIHYLCAEKPWQRAYPRGHCYREFRNNVSFFEYPQILLADVSQLRK